MATNTESGGSVSELQLFVEGTAGGDVWHDDVPNAYEGALIEYSRGRQRISGRSHGRHARDVGTHVEPRSLDIQRQGDVEG
jgi:hypothetical protein